MKIKICANTQCELSFSPTRHNQKYCNRQCCRAVTNAKAKQQYHERKERKEGKIRICQRCETTRLSRYNEGVICQSCIASEKSESIFALLQLVGAR